MCYLPDQCPFSCNVTCATSLDNPACFTTVTTLNIPVIVGIIAAVVVIAALCITAVVCCCQSQRAWAARARAAQK